MLLPEPLGPARTRIWPGFHSSETSRSANPVGGRVAGVGEGDGAPLDGPRGRRERRARGSPEGASGLERSTSSGRTRAESRASTSRLRTAPTKQGTALAATAASSSGKSPSTPRREPLNRMAAPMARDAAATGARPATARRASLRVARRRQRARCPARSARCSSSRPPATSSSRAPAAVAMSSYTGSKARAALDAARLVVANAAPRTRDPSVTAPSTTARAGKGALHSTTREPTPITRAATPVAREPRDVLRHDLLRRVRRIEGRGERLVRFGRRRAQDVRPQQAIDDPPCQRRPGRADHRQVEPPLHGQQHGEAQRRQEDRREAAARDPDGHGDERAPGEHAARDEQHEPRAFARPEHAHQGSSGGQRGHVRGRREPGYPERRTCLT